MKRLAHFLVKRHVFVRGPFRVEVELSMLPRPYLMLYNEDEDFVTVTAVFGVPGLDHIFCADVEIGRRWWA